MTNLVPDPPGTISGPGESKPSTQCLITRGVQGSSSECGTPFAILSRTAQGRISSLDDCLRDMNFVSRCLTPWDQARQLLDQFVMTIQRTYWVLHIPSTRILIDKTYQNMLKGEEPSSTVMSLLFSIFSGAALLATPEFLQVLNATQAEAKAAFATYTRLAIAIIDNPIQPVPPSTVALEAISTLSRVLSHADWYSNKVQTLRVSAICMARTMQIHRLDTAKNQEERQRSGYDVIEVEVQRRIWWHLVSTDWITAFSQSPHEGSYLIHPKHMKVNHPINIEDDLITSTGPEYGLPPSVPTSMSIFIFRLHYAELCREVIDIIGPTLLESEQPDYETILDIDRKFHTFLRSTPAFFQIDTDHSQEIFQERPYLSWQRTMGHLSFHVRLCRLHRPYHREGITNPKYAYSRLTCIRSAQTVLDLRRSLEKAGSLAGSNPSDYGLVMNHVFFAAMILATDVSMNPTSPGADTRKQEVLDIIHLLENSQNESPALVEAIQKNMQTLLSILQGSHRQHSRTPPTADTVTVPPEIRTSAQLQSQLSDVGLRDGIMAADGQVSSMDNMAGANEGAMWSEAGNESWGQLWSDLFDVAPEMDGLQWDLLLNDSDLPLQTNFY
ncbi:Zn(II)2Cys6 transcription factor [Aspergillus sclerotioniger CBS 115572]|uniref:Zn(II)2Cys6 transcription factor n=1 Tax=Aspergillus sclerotioniger CBS 115572 TaxID=1450535 RepID=A0A317WTS7_9EURO|nr:Zn(II)2Cys6 transcription factor [Aspergillus sclerotioniger CBS 115572]PWY88682.1 Zn(II)2Cys6 transcription factor [Aspergillus sclerotioniger CBS 115572]